jgi:parvulin-like peptidyl-prolyl isomerase
MKTFIILGETGPSDNKKVSQQRIEELLAEISSIRKEQTASKQAYLQQRQKLNPEVFTILNRNYLRRFYSGMENC